MYETKVSEFESIIWSLFASLGIYAVFGYFTGLFNLDLIRTNILNPINIASVFGLAVAFGGGFGLLSRLLFKQGLKAGDCWEACIKAAANSGSYVLVYTSANQEYKGEMLFGSVSEAPKEIVIKNPKLILRDENLKVKSELQVGNVMIFRENDIRRIAFLKEIFSRNDAK